MHDFLVYFWFCFLYNTAVISRKEGYFMLSNFLIVIGQVVTLFLMMGVGFVLTKLNCFSVETSGQCTKLLLYVVCPCIVITKLQLEATPQVVRILLVSTLSMAATYAVVILLSYLFFRKSPTDTRVVYRFGVTYGNVGFMGFPLLAGVLGEDSMLFGVVALVVFFLFQWTHGVLAFGGKLNPRSLIVNPGILATLVGVLFFAVGFQIPAPVFNAMDFISDLNTPLAMVVIGSQMARSDILRMLKKPRLYLASAFKLILVPAVTGLVLLPFHLSPMAY